MRYFIFFGLLLSLAFFEMGCNNGAPGQASNESDFVETLCDTVLFREVDPTRAQLDSSQYATFINEVKLPKGYNITNPRVTYFVVPVRHIDTLIKWKTEGKIMPNPNGDDPTWTMLALEKDRDSDSLTIVPYFACYSSSGGKQGPIVYFKLPEHGPIDTILQQEAKDNVDSMRVYLFKLSIGKKLFYPHGFQFPWNDMTGLACSLQGEGPNNSLHGVLVIKDVENKRGKIEHEVDYYLHAFYKSKAAKSRKARPGDDGDYFDFTSPCPNSCPQ